MGRTATPAGPRAFWHRLARLPSPFWGRLSRAETLEEHRLPQQRGFLASTRPPPLNLLGQAQQGRDPGGTRTSTAKRLLASTRPPPLALLGQAQQGRHPGGAPPPKKNDKVLTSGKLNGCPWTVSGEADTLEGRGLEKTTKCCRGDQRDLRKQSVKSAAWVGRPPPLWRRLARLPSPFWGRLSRADALDQNPRKMTGRTGPG
ncbi:hypothetical protein ROHU_025825 [Labeo rohita]|uniref:Uncharacterized protein n=1 Tax=Labeo rohita TaxID=84645 RepID=A0A498MEA9_LABRO|nr:hypothetical protein ROHU_025825 [Labeo rohita]